MDGQVETAETFSLKPFLHADAVVGSIVNRQIADRKS